MRKVNVALFALVLIIGMSTTASALPLTPEHFEGYDNRIYMFSSTGQIEVQLNALPAVPVAVSGLTRIHTWARLDSTDHRWKLEAEIDSMALAGMSPMGPIVVFESFTKVSSGAVKQINPEDNFPSNSYFDVYFEIPNTPWGTLHNKDPKRMETPIDTIPPLGEIYQSPQVVDLYDSAETIVLGQILYAEHTPEQTIPALSEWGALIFGTLLLGSVAFYIWRKRRHVAA